MPVPPGPLPLLRCRPRDVLSTAEEDDLGSSLPDSYCCRFCPRPGSQHVLASADEDGTIKLWDTRPSARQRIIHSESAHTNAIYELDWSRDGRHLLSAAGDRAIKLWDADRLMTPLAEFRRHSRTVKTATFLPDDPCVFASGGRDGVIEVWDMRVTKQISHEIRPRGRGLEPCFPPRRSDIPDSITSLVFRDSTYLLSAASGDGGVSVWDLRKLYSAGQRQPPPLHRLDTTMPCRGVVSMATDRQRDQLYVCRINDDIQRYSLTNWTADPAGVFSGHRCGSFYIRCAVSPDGSRLASGNSDHTALLWSTAEGGAPAARLPGHTDEVTCVAWSADSNTLATVSDDLHLRLWRTDPCPGDPADGDSTLLMERLSRPADGDSAGPPPPPLPLHTLCRETGTRWRPGRVRGAPEPPQPPSAAAPAAAPARQRARQARRTPAAFLAGWLRGGRRTTGATPTRTSPRKRPPSDAEEESREDETVSPGKRRPVALALSPSKMCFSPGSPTKSGSVTPVQSPFKRYSPSLSPSKANTSDTGAITPTGVRSSRPGSTQRQSPWKADSVTPTKSPSRRRTATPSGSPSRPSCSTGRSPRRSLLYEVNGERVTTPTSTQTRTPTRSSPRKAAAMPSCSNPSTPAGSSRPGSSVVHSPRTPSRSSPRKTPAKVLFSSDPAARCAVTPETCRLPPADQYRSPTANLPNLVVDGRSPHRPPSARPRRQPRPDWLTCLSQRKRAQASPAAAPPAAKRTRRAAGGRKQTPG